MTRILLAGIELPADLQWTDEFTAWRVGQQVRNSLNGAMIVQESARQAGRPITLQTTRDGTAYVGVVALPIVRALQASESEARLSPLELVMPAHNGGDRTFQVRWRRVDGPAIEVEPTRFAVPALDSDLFSITLRLMTV
ncbi:MULTISPECIES: hypothetical protein [Stenotrophomonas]|jgi:hypothetical protein|uniref:Uncharacterized protein n=1 Tax=Stenotrophomonas maltophilia TaxID=40324 RepID=A0AAJ2WKX1_STEMA|nr:MULTISPECIES: hypothetical protein [Stenotrophomonas]AVH91668.1 hypothetical protein AL480_12795 [Stenotrophomonas maltophilia]EKT2104865.1 hypothetical protein [Stenotrophomonas maltophilia]EKT4075699.1 hypothetical protein [Stenotrophomonas maltophilia]EMB2829794.1 hypothetical protein [Stenotrophomonas maltophilia]KOO73428.1 hypothetical protein VK66_12785 [Stenotrophomonas maltophilia]